MLVKVHCHLLILEDMDKQIYYTEQLYRLGLTFIHLLVDKTKNTFHQEKVSFKNGLTIINVYLQGNYTIVSGLVADTYRSLDAKNELGQTAVHLAAKNGIDDILTKLIESKASVNCRDSAGYTPLHVSLPNNE